MKHKAKVASILLVVFIAAPILLRFQCVNAITPSYLTAIRAAANRLVALRSNAPFVPPYASPPTTSPDYGWDWNVTGLLAHSNNRSATNIYGVTALGLAEVWNRIGMTYLVAAAYTASFMKYGNPADGDFWYGMPPDYYYYWGYAADYIFLMDLAATSGNTIYSTYALAAWNWMVANVSYYDDGSQAQTWAHFYVITNKPGYTAWSTGLLGQAALLVGDTSWSNHMADEIHTHVADLIAEALTPPGLTNIADLGLGETLQFFATSPYASATYPADITAMAAQLLAAQDGVTGAWQQNGADSTQTTAYVVMGLEAAGYYTAGRAGADYLVSSQLLNGGWLESAADPTEYSESDSEVLQALISSLNYKLTVTSAYGTTTGSGWYGDGVPAYAGLSIGTNPDGVGKREVFATWSGDASGTNYALSDPITMSGDKTAIASWKTQWYITVTSAHGTPTASGWVDQTTGSFTASVTSPADIVANDHQWVCTGYSIGGGAPVSGTTYTFTNVQAAHTIVFNWKEQFWIQVNSAQDFPSASQWVDQGGSLTVSVTSLAGVVPNDHQWVCAGYTLDANSPVTDGTVIYSFTNVLAAHTITFNWKEQFWVSFTQSGLDNSATGTVVTINGVPKTIANLPIAAGWFDSGTTYSYSSQISSAAPGERFMQTSVSGPSSPITAAGTVTGNYTTQYYLTVSSYSGLPAPTPASGWFDAGSQVTLTAPQTGHDPQGTSYAFHVWSLHGVDISGGNTVQITMPSSPTVAIAWYVDPPTFGDVNNDGRVDLIDLVLVARHYGTVLGNPGYSILYDLNGDGRVDLMDLAAVARAIQP